ncbi:MAG: hypothetical protein K8S99_17505 [Planctomycetes bacterium]|nr:hypothetical protein [Planctomycetota bacterium]
MMRLTGVLSLSVVFCLAVARSVHGQAVAAPTPPPNVLQAVAPGATCLAVSDTLGLLVVGQAGLPHQLSLFKLDAAGKIAGAPQPITLPRPDSLKAFPNAALGAAFHPTLPVLYVWQDIDAKAPIDKAKAEFDHLLVFTVKDGALVPAMALGRGAEFVHGQSWGAIGLDARGQRIFLPNLIIPGASQSAIGFYELGPDGLPIVIDGVIKPTVTDVAAILNLPNGLGFVAPTRDAVVFSAVNGPATWDTTNRLGAINHYGMSNVPAQCAVGGRPDGAWVYGASLGSNVLYAMQQADGFITMMPTVVSVPGADLRSIPVVMPGRPARLAVGAAQGVCFVSLDAEGRPTDQSVSLPVVSPAVRGIAWSDKFKLLFVAVEKTP